MNLLLNSKSIGIYNKCEIIEIFGLWKEKKEFFNIYTLIVFENTKQENINNMLTEKLQSFKGYKEISWGINRRVIEIEKVKKLYDELLEKNEYKLDNTLNVGKLLLLPDQYVPVMNINKSVQINNIIKNNFDIGSYILEFFDETKNNLKFLLDNPILLNSLSEQVSSILPIKIGTLSDRLGNIIFQLPINSVEINLESIKDKNSIYPKFIGFKIEIFPKIDSLDIKNLFIRIYEEDETITRHKIITVEDEVTEIFLDDSFATRIEIINKGSGLLLYKSEANIMKEMNFNISVSSQQKRVFELNGQKKQLELVIRDSNVYRKTKDKSFNRWIQDRKYEAERKELEENKLFVQYFCKEEEKALRDIRELINKYGANGVYLWDPYLSAIDIKNTLYYAKYSFVPMKAISGLKQVNSKTEAKQKMLDEFQKDKQNFLFLNLEVRGKIGNQGYDFHDRFIIFPSEKPKVWSLGASINQLGESHHILQEVKNAQHIVNAFDKLWEELSSEECLIWKIK